MVLFLSHFLVTFPPTSVFHLCDMDSKFPLANENGCVHWLCFLLQWPLCPFLCPLASQRQFPPHFRCVAESVQSQPSRRRLGFRCVAESALVPSSSAWGIILFLLVGGIEAFLVLPLLLRIHQHPRHRLMCGFYCSL